MAEFRIARHRGVRPVERSRKGPEGRFLAGAALLRGVSRRGVGLSSPSVRQRIMHAPLRWRLRRYDRKPDGSKTVNWWRFWPSLLGDTLVVWG